MLDRLFSFFKAPAEEPAAPQLSPAIRSHASRLLGVRGLPTLPSTAQRALSLLHDPSSGLEQFAELIEADEAWSARILRLAHSAYFQRGARPETLLAALQTIGLEELRCVLHATLLRDLFPSRHPFRSPLWIHNFTVAIICQMLARRAVAPVLPQAFLAGLTHDLGKLVCMERDTALLDRVLASLPSHSSYLEAEIDHTPILHTELGQLVAEAWGFPVSVVEAIRLHHEPPVSAAPRLVHVVAAANTAAHALGYGYAQPLTALREKSVEILPSRLAPFRLDADCETFLETLRREIDAHLEEYLLAWE